MSYLCVYVLIKKGDKVQIIHANFVSSSVMILREIPKMCSSQKGVNS
jgi:hypothetical protein